MQVDMIQEAADCLMEANDFEKAKNVCKNYAPELESYVDEKYKLHLKHSGDIKSVSCFVEIFCASISLLKKMQTFSF